MRFITTFSLAIFTTILFSQTSSFIHVDQFGYFPDAEKVAVLSDPQVGYNASESYTPSNNLEVRRADNDEVVLSGNIETYDAGNIDALSGDRGWWFDFTSLNDAGEYYIYDTQNDERSAIFEISDTPYKEVMKAAGRMFFYNRCNFAKEVPFAEANWTDSQNFLNPLQDANVRYIDDPANSSLEKDLRGGWFDAGDYNKYVTFTEGTLNDLLWALEDNPEAFGDNWNIPESGNGFPDLLDEIKWELEWLLRMTNDDGSVHIKVGSQNYAENVLSPPSLNTDQRFYGPTCTSASAAMAHIFSHAAIVFEEYEGLESFAGTLEENAKRAFEYTLPFFNNNELEEDCDDGSIVAGDADRNADNQRLTMIVASVYLYELTGDETYHDFFKNHFDEAPTFDADFWGADDVFLQDALMRYATSDYGETLVKDVILLSATVDVNNNYNGFHRWSENHLYRAFMPEWSHYWGSNRPRAGYGNLNMTMAMNEIGNDVESIKRKAAEHLHYFHGINPMGMVMLSNMYGYGAENCVNEIYHTWFYDGTEYDHALDSPKGPAPGFVTGGPNLYFSYTQLSPPSNQPSGKSYLDFNLGWPESSWEISEPAIYYQAAYIRFLAHFVEADFVSSLHGEVKDKEINLKVLPNPTTDWIFPQYQDGVYSVSIFDVNGKLMKDMEWQNGQGIEVRRFPGGIYFFHLTDGENRVVQKWIKE